MKIEKLKTLLDEAKTLFGVDELYVDVYENISFVNSNVFIDMEKEEVVVITNQQET